MDVVSVKNRSWSIRAKIMALAIVPLIAITALSLFGLAVTGSTAIDLLDVISYQEAVTGPGGRLVDALQDERRISAGAEPGDEQVDKARQVTDAADQEFRKRLRDNRVYEKQPPDKLQLIEAFIAKLDTLPAIRQDADQKPGRLTAAHSYSDLIDLAYRMWAPMTDLPDVDMARQAHGLFAISRAQELLSREDALITGVLSDGEVSVAEQALVLHAIGARRQEHEEARATLSRTPNSERFETIFVSDAYVTVFSMEEAFTRIASDRRAPIDLEGWRAAADNVLATMDTTEDQSIGETVRQANASGARIFILPVAVTLLGLICTAVAIIMALRTGRSVVRRLETLRASALQVAHDHLPRTMAALRDPSGPVTDPASLDLPVVAVGSDELGQVGHAFATVQRAAIRAAVDEANLRRGLNDVFLNIARRSQALVHRQLTLLDKMERRANDPRELEDLFRVDHMATRMRRHAEALVILAGSVPGRGWRHPVPLVDVVRGATSEIEDYVRVNLIQLPDVRILGHAVGDLTHLLAELLENATSFSPPHTRVRVYGEMVSAGAALSIEDGGLGMSDAELAEANARLTDPPAFDPASSARLGLLVVAKLAARQGVKVHLRTSPYGGVTAVVLIPSELVVATATEVKPQQRELPPRVTASQPVRVPASPAAGALPRRVRQNTTETVRAASQPSQGQTTAQSSPVTEDETTAALSHESTDETTVRLTHPDATAESTAKVPQPRSAEQVRTMMSAFQAGSVRARRDALASAPVPSDEPEHRGGDRTEHEASRPERISSPQVDQVGDAAAQTATQAAGCHTSQATSAPAQTPRTTTTEGTA